MKFSVPEMSCGHCTAAIEKAVTAAEPAARATCDLEGRIVEIAGGASAAAIADAIRGAGYEARLLDGS